MAITQEQADTANVFHQNRSALLTQPGNPCESRRGPIRWRRNGKTQRRVRQPGTFTIPVKYGLRQCSYITADNQDQFHTGADCPHAPEGHN